MRIGPDPASITVVSHPSWSSSTFVPIAPSHRFNGLPSTTGTPLPSSANQPSVSVSEIFLLQAPSEAPVAVAEPSLPLLTIELPVLKFIDVLMIRL